MIYCIGYRQSYDPLFQLLEAPLKMGRTRDYPGGSVWLTQAEATVHCRPGFAVYGVLADWATDTAASAEGPWRDLLVDARLVQLPLALCTSPSSGECCGLGTVYSP